MKYCNLVYAKHENCAKPFLFGAPLEQEIHKGQKLMVKTRIGLKEATATAASFILPAKIAITILNNDGGYYPPAPVVATLEPVTVRGYKVSTFDDALAEEINNILNVKGEKE